MKNLVFVVMITGRGLILKEAVSKTGSCSKSSLNISFAKFHCLYYACFL